MKSTVHSVKIAETNSDNLFTTDTQLKSVSADFVYSIKKDVPLSTPDISCKQNFRVSVQIALA